MRREGIDPPRAHELSGDARLQFWREAYLVGLRAWVARIPEGAVFDPTRLAQVSDAVSLLADFALTAHLSRCKDGAIDAIVDGLLAQLKER